jgi:hypothetical protein
MAAARQGLPVRLERAPHRGAAFALSNASKRARARSNASVVRSSGAFLPPSPPAEEATARQDQAGEASTGDGGGHYEAEIIGGLKHLARGGKMLIVRPETRLLSISGPKVRILRTWHRRVGAPLAQPVSGPEPVQTQAEPVPVPRTPGRPVAAVNPYSVGLASTACTKA